ncbi:MAG: shikimate kinase [Desulfobacterales bacterium]
MAANSGNIYFCGMIGSGKTTIGSRLAEELALPFYDLDREMDRRLGYSFHRLIQQSGWVTFRELEYSICKDFATLGRSLVCLGGGTVRYEWNRDVLRGTGLVILLTASLPELAQRVRRADRPRVNAGASLEEDLEKIWSESAETYRRAADRIHSTEGKGVEQVVEELKPVLRDFLRGG